MSREDNLRAHRAQQERAAVRAAWRDVAASLGIPCPERGRIPARVWSALADLGIRPEWGISVNGADPTEDDLFASGDDADEAVWAEGGERVMVRFVTPWTEAAR